MDLNYTKKVSIGGQEVSGEEHEVLQNRGYDRFQNVMVYAVGGPAFLILLGLLTYQCGQKNPDCRSNCQSAIITATPAPTETGTLITIPGLDRLASTLEKIAEQKANALASAGASATASAATTVIAPPPPRTERRVPAAKQQVEPACQCPPEPAVKTPATDPSPSPAPTLSFAEHRRNEMWSALQR